jgi:hypothetical protein
VEEYCQRIEPIRIIHSNCVRVFLHLSKVPNVEAAQPPADLQTSQRVIPSNLSVFIFILLNCEYLIPHSSQFTSRVVLK